MKFSTNIPTRFHEEAKKEVAAWLRGVERSNGGQPTAKLIADIVADVMAEEDTEPKQKPARTSSEPVTFDSLRAAVDADKSKEEIHRLINMLEKVVTRKAKMATT